MAINKIKMLHWSSHIYTMQYSDIISVHWSKCYTSAYTQQYTPYTCIFFRATIWLLTLQRARNTTLNWPRPIFFSISKFFRAQYRFSWPGFSRPCNRGGGIVGGIIANCGGVSLTGDWTCIRCCAGIMLPCSCCVCRPPGGACSMICWPAPTGIRWPLLTTI